MRSEAIRGELLSEIRETAVGMFRHTRSVPGLILVTLLSAFACYLLAKSRSADRRFWLVMGLFFGPLAIPFVFFAKPKGEEERGAGP